MRLIKNSGNDRVIDELRKALLPQSTLDIASPAFSLFAYAEVQGLIDKLGHSRLVLPTADGYDLNLLGSEAELDRAATFDAAFPVEVADPAREEDDLLERKVRSGGGGSQRGGQQQ